MEARKAAAARLSMPWPRPHVRAVGRPPKAKLYREARHRAVEGDCLPESASADLPIWWEPGMPVTIGDNERVALAAPATPEQQFFRLPRGPGNGKRHPARTRAS